MTTSADETLLDKMVRAVELVRERLLRATAALVRMKLTSFCDKDRTHLRDLIDASWPARFLPELGARLQQLVDTPEG